MPEKVIDVYRKAESDFVEDKFNEALAGFTEVMNTDPDHLWTRFQVGRALERLKENNRAFEVFNTLASHCIKAGFPLFGVVMDGVASSPLYCGHPSSPDAPPGAFWHPITQHPQRLAVKNDFIFLRPQFSKTKPCHQAIKQLILTAQLGFQVVEYWFAIRRITPQFRVIPG